ncbi:MAG TPA: MogA/MoaB family molybdenum cofactor biosynthesis protein [Acidimicrobiia bacterium]|nr:MogA/MoaB family molybdenum cofactor biosynthesis protein [Acidimicrobiia bacterium]
MPPPAAVVITVSDGVSSGTREDGSGEALERMLTEHGYEVTRDLVPDDHDRIVAAVREACSRAGLVVTTGGTGFGLRDVTPEATGSILERDAPGLVQLMIAKGLESTPMAALTRARAGTVGHSLVVNLPGSPKGASENLEAIIDLIPHALQLLSGDNQHH